MVLKQIIRTIIEAKAMRSCGTRRIILPNLTARCPRSSLPILSSSPTFSRSRTKAAGLQCCVLCFPSLRMMSMSLSQTFRRQRSRSGWLQCSSMRREAHLASKEDEFKEKQLSQPHYPRGTRPWTISCI